jgi:hypothetical protein
VIYQFLPISLSSALQLPIRSHLSTSLQFQSFFITAVCHQTGTVSALGPAISGQKLVRRGHRSIARRAAAARRCAGAHGLAFLAMVATPQTQCDPWRSGSCEQHRDNEGHRQGAHEAQDFDGVDGAHWTGLPSDAARRQTMTTKAPTPAAPKTIAVLIGPSPRAARRHRSGSQRRRQRPRPRRPSRRRAQPVKRT